MERLRMNNSKHLEDPHKCIFLQTQWRAKTSSAQYKVAFLFYKKNEEKWN